MTRFYRVMYTLFVKPVSALFRIRVTGLEKLPEGGCLLCANHTSMLDVLILSAGTHRQIRYMAKKELFAVPGLKQLITALGAYPVDRRGADVASLKRTISLIGEGETVGVFPQGTRHAGENPAETEVRHGVGMITWHAKATVVPIYIAAKGNKVRFFHRTDMIIGDPIPFEELGMTGAGRAQYTAATEKIFTEICALGGYERAALPAPEADA